MQFHRIIKLLILSAACAFQTHGGEVAGCLFAPATTNAPAVILPLKKTEVSIDVSAGIAQTEVVQRFHNDLDRPLEAVYLFPLPSEAAVSGFEIRLDDRIIRSEVREREEAKAAYEQAKSEGKKAALLEQERPNLFTTSVANLLPGETVDICLTYTEPLRFRRTRYDITFPMVTGERYIPAGVVPDAARLNAPVLPATIDPEHRLSLDVSIHGLPVEQITSTTHAIDVAPTNGDEIHVSLAKQVTIPNCAFSIAVELQKTESPAVSFAQSVEDGETFGLLSVFPPMGTRDPAQNAQPKDVIFLIDTSGSMCGESISQARSGLRRCLNMLHPGDRFAIIRFASEYSFFSPELRDASPEKLDDARDYIDGLNAGGGTEMQPALEFALDLPKTDDHQPMIIFLTDGDVGNEDSLSALLLSKHGNTRVFSFGIGSAPNEFLINRMADIGRGQARFIRSHEDIGDVMADFFQTLENPALTDVTLEWDDPSVQVYPERCPDVYYQRPLQLVARTDGPFTGGVRVTGKIDGEPVSFRVELDDDSDEEHPAISRLFGRMEIKALMLTMLQAKTPAERDGMKREVIRTALHYQLVSKFTSRVAIEETVTVENGEAVTVKVPLPAPRGWTMYAGATADPLQMLAGLLTLAAAGLGWRRLRNAQNR